MKRLAKISEGSEHAVYLMDGGASVLKVTKPNTFGEWYFLASDGRVNQRRCTPSDYFTRLILLALAFDFAPAFSGVTPRGQIVTLQKFVKGEPPTQAEADEFLAGYGFEPVRQDCFIWRRSAPDDFLEYWIGDARDENFVKTPQGIVPIDLRMWGFSLGE